MGLWIMLLLVSSAALAVLVALLLPRIFLKNRFAINESYDRGIKKYRFRGNGVGLLCEPGLRARPYVRQYLLTLRNGEKTIKCKVAKNLTYLDYDIVLFNGAGKVFDILNIREMIGKREYTDEIKLPEETSFVTVLINQADNKVFEKNKSVRLSPIHLVLFAATVAALSCCVCFCVKLSFAQLFGRVFRESFMASQMGNMITLIASLIIGALGVAITMTVLILKKDKAR